MLNKNINKIGMGLALSAGVLFAASVEASGSYNVINLGTLPGDVSSRAQDVNNSGQVVGFSSAGPLRTSNRQAFVYSNGVMSPLGSVNNGTNSQADGINNSGQISVF